MAKQSSAWVGMQKNRWALVVLALFSLSTAMVFFMRTTFDSCSAGAGNDFGEGKGREVEASSVGRVRCEEPNPLGFMKSKLVLLVSHELSPSGGPLLLMELAFLLRGVGSEVVWITNQKPAESDEVIHSLERKMLDRGVQGTAAGGTMEIVLNGTTGFLHPVGKEGVTPLANNIVKLATHVERRMTMGKQGYERIKETFLEHHMAHRIALVLKEVLAKAKSSNNS